MESVSLIDIGAEDEDLLFSISVAASFEALENCGSATAERMKILTKSSDEFKMQIDHAPVLFDSTETKRGASRKFNLRKSLAWDSAFFTCEGVLDPEELAIVNTRSTQALPGVQEDMRKSIDSNATFDSDDCTVESIEIGHIETSRTALGSPRKCHKESTKDRLSSRNMKKPINTSNEHGTKQAKKVNTNGNRELKSSMKPPRVAYGMVASNRKPFAPKPFQGKEKTNKASAGDKKSTTLPKKIAAREPHSAIPKFSSTKFSSATTTSNKVSPNTTCSTYTETKSKTADIKNVRKKNCLISSEKSIRDASNNPPATTTSNKVSPNTACSTYIETKSKTADIKNVRKKNCLISSEKSIRDASNNPPAKLSESEKELEIICRTSQHPSSIISSSGAPNRSLDSMSSESSFSSISLSRSSSSTDTKDDIFGTSSCRQSAKTFSSRSTVSNDPSASDSSRCQVGKLSRTCSKISGLRMPSPKVGYFDTEKSVVCDTTSSQKGSETSDRQKTRGIKKEKVLARSISGKIHDVLLMTSIKLPGGTGGQIIINSSEMISNDESHLAAIKIGVGKPLCEAEVEMKDESLTIHEMKDSNQNQPNLKPFDKPSLKGSEDVISQQAGFDVYPQEKYVVNSLDGMMASDLQLPDSAILGDVTKSSNKENLLPFGEEDSRLLINQQLWHIKETKAELVEQITPVDAITPGNFKDLQSRT